MAANYDIDPIHLRTNEINYELRIRNVVTDKVDIALKRKYLRRELRKDLARPEAHVYRTVNFDFELEQKELKESIKSVTDLVNDYDGINTEVGNRIRSRINHILGRLGRIPEDISEDICNYRGDNIIMVTALEEDLEEIIKRNLDGEQARISQNLVPVNSTVGTSKTVPVYKWPVKFRGRGDKGSLNSFLQRVEELRIARKCTKQELFQAVSDLFEDHALEWYRAQLRHGRFDTWDSLEKALKEDFLPRDYDRDLWKQIEKRTQHVSEPVVVYISIMENLFECLSEKPSEEKRLNTLKSNILPEYQSHIVLQEVTDVKCLVRLCRMLEESEKSKREFRPPPNKNVFALEPNLACSMDYERTDDRTSKPSSYHSEDIVSHPNISHQHSKTKGNSSRNYELRCWNCNKVGHVKQDCRKVNGSLRCYGCGMKGVIRPNCPKCHPKNVNAENDK